MNPLLLIGAFFIALGLYWHVRRNDRAITYMGVPILALASMLGGAAVIAGVVIGILL